MTPRRSPPSGGAAPRRGLELLVVQPTPFCNLDCDYCYLPHRDSRRTITVETLERVFAQVLSSRYVTGPLSVVWHAGEPLVLPPSFYEEAFAALAAANRRGVPVRHCFQTNATLVDTAWCELIERFDIRVGVSIDGPPELHDAHRRTRDGRGTFDRVLAGVRRLQEHGTPFYVITVLTRDSLDRADELFAFYRDHDLRRVCFNVEEIEGVHGASSLAVAGAEDRLRRFLRRFLELARNSDFPLEVREIEGMRRLVERSGGFLERSQENTPLRILSVDCAGNFSTFSPELLGMRAADGSDFLLGNLHRDDLDAVEETARFREMAARIEAGVAACRAECDYFGVCGGGSPSNKFFENGAFESTETMHCRLTKKVMSDIALDHLERALADGRLARAAVT